VAEEDRFRRALTLDRLVGVDREGGSVDEVETECDGEDVSSSSVTMIGWFGSVFLVQIVRSTMYGKEEIRIETFVL